MRGLRYGVIEGSHWHTEIHISAFDEVGCQLVGLSDQSAEERDRLSELYDEPTFSTASELIDATSPDFVVVLGRHSEMPRLATEVAQAGVPFALEKPCAVSGAALRPLVDLVEASDLFAAVPLANRHRDLWSREKVDHSVFGHFRICTGPVDRYLDWGVPWVLDPELSGGGAMRNIGIHTVDAYLRMVEFETIEVRGATLLEHPDYPGIDIHTVALLEADGVSGIVEASYTYPDANAADVEWRIASPEAYVRDRAGYYERADSQGVHHQERTETPTRYVRFAADFCERLRGECQPEATVRDAWQALSVIDEIYQAAPDTSLVSP